MHKLLEIYKTLDDWDLIKTDKGTIGLVLNGYIHSQSPINLNDYIVETKNSSIDLDELWDNIPSDEDDSVFVGVSYEANPDDLKDIKTQYKNIIEYNDDGSYTDEIYKIYGIIVVFFNPKITTFIRSIPSSFGILIPH